MKNNSNDKKWHESKKFQAALVVLVCEAALYVDARFMSPDELARMMTLTTAISAGLINLGMLLLGAQGAVESVQSFRQQNDTPPPESIANPRREPKDFQVPLSELYPDDNGQ